MNRSFLLAILILCFLVSGADASKAKPFKSQQAAEFYLNEHYNLGCKYYNKQDWRNAYTHFEKVIYFFPGSEEAAEASYYLGVCYFEMKEYDFANKEFSSYITASAHPAYFEDAARFKFCIAEHFKNGKKRRAFNSRYCPKWISAEEEALTIFDEVIIALPNHELTICALRSKAELLRRMGQYRECVDTYQVLIRRFPKDEYTPECYVKIGEVFCEQSQFEFQNPDILAFAELNARKFSEDFPRDERVECVNGFVQRIKENYAKGLCNLGLFYERKHHPQAAAIYYKTSIAEFPNTACADFCRARLECLVYEKEEKDVVVPVSILKQELDPLEYEEKATPAEGDFIDGLPQVEAPAIEATDPSEGYEKYIENVVSDPVSCECSDPQISAGNDFYTVEVIDPPVRYDYNQQASENIQADPNIIYNDQVYLHDGDQGFFYPYNQYEPEIHPAPSEYDLYDCPPKVTGSEEENMASFQNGQTYYHNDQEEERYYYQIVREKEPPPATYLHYSLLKHRLPVKDDCQPHY
jgi:outer membrane protein assembly factor BamD (BamD/ComL family)